MGRFVRHASVDQRVGTQLQNLRLFRGLDRRRASDALNISEEVLESLERGATRPEPEMVLIMARLYKVPPSRVFALLAGEEPA